MEGHALIVVENWLSLDVLRTLAEGLLFDEAGFKRKSFVFVVKCSYFVVREENYVGHSIEVDVHELQHRGVWISE